MATLQGKTGSGARQSAATIGAAALLLLAGFCLPAMAQSNPADSILRQNEERARELDRATTPTQRGEPVLAQPTQRADLPPPGGPTVYVKTVVFDPVSAFLSDGELERIAARYTGRRLDFSQIASLVRDVNDLYAAKGVVTASAILPPQKLSSGTLKVQLVEGRQGVVSIVGEHRTRNQFLLDRVRLTRAGDVVDVPTAAKDITWFNRAHRAQIRLLLQPGAAFGLTDLTLGVTEPPPHFLQLSLDNQGPASTGTVQWGASYRAYGMLGIDDSLLVSVTASEGSTAGTAGFDMPLTRSGTRLALGYTASAIRVIDGPTASLGITGRSQVGSATLSQPLIASPSWTLLASGAASYGESLSKSETTPLVDSDTTKGAVGLSLGFAQDRFSFSVYPQMVYAHAVDRLAAAARDLPIATGTANAALHLTDSLSLMARGAWQQTGEQLLPGDLLFQVGGPTTVRGYPSDGVAGDSGYFAQAELHWNLADVAEGLDVFVFTDIGEVFSTFPARTTLASVGAGVTYNWKNRFTFDLFAGIPVIDAVADQSDITVYGRVTGAAF